MSTGKTLYIVSASANSGTPTWNKTIANYFRCFY